MAVFRRRPCLAAYWVGETLRVENYLTQRVSDLEPLHVAILGALDVWRSTAELCEKIPRTGKRPLTAALDSLIAGDLIESSDRALDSRECRFQFTWEHWSPSAAFFHFATKDVPYDVTDQDFLRVRRLTEGPPEMLRLRRGSVVKLPAFPRRGTLPRVLLARRSWRAFGKRPLTMKELSALAGLTWAVQRWVRLAPDFALPLKTSPSGGACHSIEVYFAVRRVRGLAPGLYHYRPDSHALVRLRKGWTGRTLSRRLGGQPWFAKSAVVAFMTSAVERVQFKYRFARAYRVVLLEAGHFCQTFCLVATWLGLAPFCTAAIADSAIERDLSIDGVGECVLYAAGVGTRPQGAAWAPWPDMSHLPPTHAPAHRLPARSKRQGRTAS
jgi:SagB-type dehydrogenase family enzyme